MDSSRDVGQMEDVERILYYGGEIIKQKIIGRYDNWDECDPSRVSPHGVSEWIEFLGAAGIRTVSVRTQQMTCGTLLLHEQMGWICAVSCGTSPDLLSAILCRQYCEWLMVGCPLLGHGCLEVFPVPLSQIRFQLAEQVVAELCE